MTSFRHDAVTVHAVQTPADVGPAATVDVKVSAVDVERHASIYFAVFAGMSDYVYALDFHPSTRVP